MIEHFLEHDGTDASEALTADDARTAREAGGYERETELEGLQHGVRNFFERMKEVLGDGNERVPKMAGAYLCAALAAGCASAPRGASDHDVERVLTDAVTEPAQTKHTKTLHTGAKAAWTIGSTAAGVVLEGPAALALEPLMIVRALHEAKTAARAVEAFQQARAAGGGAFAVEKLDGDEHYMLTPYTGPITDFDQLQVEHERWMTAHDAWSQKQKAHDWEHPEKPPAEVDEASLGLNVDTCSVDTGALDTPVRVHAHGGVGVLADGKFISFLDDVGKAAYEELGRALNSGCFKDGEVLYTIELVEKKPMPKHHEEFGK